jgi:hypothetical protein
MNPFEQFTIIIGYLAVLLEGTAYLGDFAEQLFPPPSKHTG